MPPDEDLRSAIRERAGEAGIDGIRFCDAAPLGEVRESVMTAVARGFIPGDRAPGAATIARFTTPRRHLRSARSIISAYQAYGADRPDPMGPAQRGAPTGTVAWYTVSDYYGDLRSRLERLAGFIRDDLGGRAKVFCCYVTLAEKPIARKAGTGFYGKHGVIVTPEHGSRVVLGEILTDLALEPDSPLETGCGPCARCIDACPTGAIRTPYFVDRNLCIQAYCGVRAVVPVAVRDAWGTRFYGCSACQDACPRNQTARRVSRKVARGYVGRLVKLADVLTIGQGEFEKRFGANQIGTREVAVIRRNAIIAAANFGSDALEDALSACAGDPDPMVRQHALWALWKTRGSAARPRLQEAAAHEAEPQVLAEVKSLLDGIGPLA
ncbi:MAG: tRNA epoxyqueuosine(34) reductase QueG [bacterium]